MADQIQITSNAAEIVRKFHRLPGVLQTSITRGLKRGLLLAEERVRKGAALKFTGSRGGLQSRLTSRVHLSRTGAMEIDGAIGFRKTRGYPYELSQEYGATAKPGHAMAIPISDEARALSARGIGPRDFPRPLIHRRKSRFLQEIVGFASLYHYVFVKHIEPRLNFRKSVRESMPEISAEIVSEYTQAKRTL
jgi:hypothetical protein